MIIIGAKGFAKEILEVIFQNENIPESIYFFDNVSEDLPDLLFGKFIILRNERQVNKVFHECSNQFILGIGSPTQRVKMNDMFVSMGGRLISLVSPRSITGQFGNSFEQGVTIMSGTVVTSEVVLKKGVLLNLNCTVGHDSILEEFVECAPGVHISGHCYVGAFTQIGTGAVLLPKITVGKNCIIGAGSVINKDIPDNSLVVGIPGKIIKNLA